MVEGPKLGSGLVRVVRVIRVSKEVGKWTSGLLNGVLGVKTSYLVELLFTTPSKILPNMNLPTCLQPCLPLEGGTQEG